MSAVRVAVAGSSGSIGTQTLDVVRAERDRYEVVGLGVGLVGRRPRRPGPRVPAQGGRRRRSGARGPRWPSALPFAEVVGDLADLAADADVVVNGVVGFAGLPVTLATLAGGQAAGAGQQGVAHRRRAGRAAAAVDAGRRAGARSTPSTAPSTSACAPTVAPGRELSRIVLTASGGPFRGRTARRPGRGHRRPRRWPIRPGAMGPKITVDSSHADEQGPRGHRGPRAVRRRLRPHRGRRPPPVDRPLDGRVHRRRPPSPSCRCPTCACPSATPSAYPEPARHAVRAHRLGRRCAGSTSSRPTWTPSAASAWPTRPAGWAGRPRRGSTPPTRWRSQAFLAGAIRLDRRSLTFSRPSFPGMMGRWPTPSTP